jgi:prenyltransferase/squalene oxidase-like repeat protein
VDSGGFHVGHVFEAAPQSQAASLSESAAMAAAAELQHKLLEAQNADGGWGYDRDRSWTEPTALALLALDAQQLRGRPYERGCHWLVRRQRSDGGWPPAPSVNVSTWVTSLALLALPEVVFAPGDYERGIGWTVRQIRPEVTGIAQFISHLRGSGTTEDRGGGSPWFPGTAAWIGPSVMSVLALSDAARRNGGHKLRSHISRNQKYILSVRCQDGGWNHGGSKFRSQNAESYPEMTGMALLALEDTRAPDLSISIKSAEKFLLCPASSEGLSWLQLGLMRQGRDWLNITTNLPCRTTRDISLRLLALAAHSTSNKLLQSC